MMGVRQLGETKSVLSSVVQPAEVVVAYLDFAIFFPYLPFLRINRDDAFGFLAMTVGTESSNPIVRYRSRSLI